MSTALFQFVYYLHVYLFTFTVLFPTHKCMMTTLLYLQVCFFLFVCLFAYCMKQIDPWSTWRYQAEVVDVVRLMHVDVTG